VAGRVVWRRVDTVAVPRTSCRLYWEEEIVSNVGFKAHRSHGDGMMPTYRCEAIHVANVTCFVEAASLEEAMQKFDKGHYDEFVNVTGDEAIECHLETVMLDVEEVNP
jgi:hypothetical protein